MGRRKSNQSTRTPPPPPPPHLNRRSRVSESKPTDWEEILNPWKMKLVQFVLEFSRTFDARFPRISSAFQTFFTILASTSTYLFHCVQRGIASFVVLGPASVFHILWCAVFSVGIVSGWTFFLIGFTVSFFIAIFGNLFLSFVILTLLSILLTFIYGSFWMTLVVLTMEGGLIYKSKYKSAIVIAFLYSTYSIYSLCGMFILLLCITLSFLSNDIYVFLSSKESFKQSQPSQSQSGPFGHPSENVFSEFHPKSQAESSQVHSDKSQSFNFSNFQNLQNPESKENSYFESSFKERVNSNYDASTSAFHPSSSPSSSSRSFPSSSTSPSSSSSRSFPSSSSSSSASNPDAGSRSKKDGFFSRKRGIFSEISSLFGFSPMPSESQSSVKTSQTAAMETENDPERTIQRILNSDDHYSVLNLISFCEIDASLIKKEYRKMAMMVHPDKHKGSESAGEAFKRLQNAYEVLTDNEKKKEYDENIQRNYYLNIIRTQLNNLLQADEDFSPDSRLVGCSSCHKSHIWIWMDRKVSESRWCGTCQAYHSSKEGDVWTERKNEIKGFNIFKKPEPIHAYTCTDKKIFQVTAWFACQKLQCVPNSHKPPLALKTGRANSKTNGGGLRFIPCNAIPNLDSLTDEEIVLALAQATTPDQNLDSAILFENLAALGSKHATGSGSKPAKSNGKRNKSSRS